MLANTLISNIYIVVSEVESITIAPFLLDTDLLSLYQCNCTWLAPSAFSKYLLSGNPEHVTARQEVLLVTLVSFFFPLPTLLSLARPPLTALDVWMPTAI